MYIFNILLTTKSQKRMIPPLRRISWLQQWVSATGWASWLVDWLKTESKGWQRVQASMSEEDSQLSRELLIIHLPLEERYWLYFFTIIRKAHFSYGFYILVPSLVKIWHFVSQKQNQILIIKVKEYNGSFSFLNISVSYTST